MLSQAQDFALECRVLERLLATLAPEDWRHPTAFKGWSANDIVVHLHFWNAAADLSARDGAAFQRLWQDVLAAAPAPGGLRAFENERVPERERALLERWATFADDMAARWRDFDPGQRVPWAGPDMSVRSAITARQMETWAHGQALFDLFGAGREETDRLKNIAVLGVNTFGWSFRVRGLEPPAEPPYIELSAPSAATWTFNDPAAAASLRGSAVEFCQVVTQTRNLADTALEIAGDAAVRWMAHPQCFAGPPETPPAPGTRRHASA
jgi:uncharacterized protein (TIGR03084 family)